MTSQPFVKDADGGRAVWHVGALLKFMATGAETDGQFWLAEQLSPAGYASPVHMHTREDEFFVVLEGELIIRIGDDEHKLGVGASAFAPRNIPHQYRVEAEGTRFLVLGTPAGFEEWFLRTGEPAQALTLPPPRQEPPDFARLMGALGPLGVELVGPPPGMGGPDGPGGPPS